MITSLQQMKSTLWEGVELAVVVMATERGLTRENVTKSMEWPEESTFRVCSRDTRYALLWVTTITNHHN